MPETDSPIYDDYNRRLSATAAERDQILAAIDGTYTLNLIAGGNPGGLYFRYQAERKPAIERFDQQDRAIRTEYAQVSPPNSPPLPPCPAAKAALSAPDESQQSSPATPPNGSAVVPSVTSSSRLHSRRRMVRGAIVILAVVIAFAVWVPSWFNASGGAAAKAAAVKASAVNYSRTVTYEVEGTATAVDITYQTPSGTAQGSNKAVPLGNKSAGQRGISFTVESGDFVYISAQNKGDSGTVTCKISVDGVLVSKVTSSGAYTIAQCDGTAP